MIQEKCRLMNFRRKKERGEKDKRVYTGNSMGIYKLEIFNVWVVCTNAQCIKREIEKQREKAKKKMKTKEKKKNSPQNIPLDSTPKSISRDILICTLL